MKHKRCAIGAAALLIVALPILFWFCWWEPRSRFRDLDWLIRTSADERRRTAEHVLWLPGDHHDAYICLMRVGRRHSVPYLLWGLRWEPEPRNGLMECTRAHCLEALITITRHDAGPSYREWKDWWDRQGRQEIE